MNDPRQREYQEALVSESGEGRGVLWERPQDGRRIAFLLDIRMEDGRRNRDGLGRHLNELHRRDFSMSALVAQYLSGAVEEGRYHIYIKAYAEVDDRERKPIP